MRRVLSYFTFLLFLIIIAYNGNGGTTPDPTLPIGFIDVVNGSVISGRAVRLALIMKLGR